MRVKGLAAGSMQAHRLTVLIGLAIVVLVCEAPTAVHGRFVDPTVLQETENRLLSNLMPQKRGSIASSPANGACPRLAQPVELPATLPATLQGLLDKLSQAYQAILDKNGAQSGALALVYGQTTLASFGLGSASDAASAATCDGDTVYRIGSVTKVFTDLLLQMEVEAGRVGADDPVSKFLDYHPAVPGLATPEAAAATTLEQLGSHQAGLPRQSPCTFGDCPLSAEEAIEALNQWTLLRYPGQRPSYSNVGFAVLAAALENATGVAWKDDVQARVLAPLGMHNTSYDAPSEGDGRVLAVGYARGTPAALVDLGFEAPAGQLYSSANDMAQVLKLLFRDKLSAHERGDQVLSGSAIRRWLGKRVWENALPVEPGYVELTGWGVPWEIYRMNLATSTSFGVFDIVTKDGSVPGYNTHLLTVPELQLGLFAAMAVGPNASRADSFNLDTLVLFGEQLVPAVQEAVSAIEPPVPMPPDSKGFCGWYNCTVAAAVPSLFVSVDAANRTLVANQLGKEIPLKWLVRDVFQMGAGTPDASCALMEEGLGVNAQFTRDSNGTVAGLGIQGAVVYPLTFARTSTSCSLDA